MRKGILVRRLLLLGALALSFFTLSKPVLGCEICKHYFFLGYVPCQPVEEDETGATICSNHYDPIQGFWCEESGNFCSSITVTGGGGGMAGGGGGTTDPCRTSGFCPAECFSCSGGGTRPAV
jgi:hypothetical protein